MNKIRLDVYLVENNLVRSRNVAQNLIEKGLVEVNNTLIYKPNHLISENDKVNVVENEKYVSRGAYKLLKALDTFKINVNNLVAIDIGASTGGFSQVLLERNIKKVYCIDVGTNQLNEKIKEDKRVINLENTNFKDIEKDIFQEKIDFICVDVSFISIIHILQKIINLNFIDIKLVVLLKPQFEVGKKISKTKGHAKKEDHKKIIDDFKISCQNFGFEIKNFVESPILGAKKNNTEYLFFLEKNNGK